MDAALHNSVSLFGTMATELHNSVNLFNSMAAELHNSVNLFTTTPKELHSSFDLFGTLHNANELQQHGDSSSNELSCNIYILLDVLLCSIAEYFYELCRILANP